MSYLDGDEAFEDFYGLHFAAAAEKPYSCDLCRLADALPDTDYCAKCQNIIDREELQYTLDAIEAHNSGVELIKQKPVDGPTFAEMKRLLGKL